MGSYHYLIDQTFDYPTEVFKTIDNELYFHGIRLTELAKKYGTPLKISYLPKISEQIQKSRDIFGQAISKNNYKGDYIYCYCTKSSHFKFVIKEVLKNNSQLETSSTYDINIIKRLYETGEIDKNLMVICNGFKRPEYQQNIADLINEGFERCIPILDNMDEIKYYKDNIQRNFTVGIRVAADEEPIFEFYTSRLGIRYGDVIDFYIDKIKDDPRIQLKMLHFFINSGIRDTQYYWAELEKFVKKYCTLKKVCDELDTIDIGGGFPIPYSLSTRYDHQLLADQIIETVKNICEFNNVPTPHLITEFGNFTVGESGAILYSVIGQKQQNDKELWYMVDGSFITQIPDTWAKNQKFIMLAVNNWNREYQQVHLGGLTCDSDDYYNSETHSANIILPKFEPGEKQYLGFFHTGAYQETLGGFGGLQHCLIPASRHIIIDRDQDGNLTTEIFCEEQKHEPVLSLLGY